MTAWQAMLVLFWLEAWLPYPAARWRTKQPSMWKTRPWTSLEHHQRWLFFDSCMGMGQAPLYHIWWNEHPFASPFWCYPGHRGFDPYLYPFNIRGVPQILFFECETCFISIVLCGKKAIFWQTHIQYLQALALNLKNWDMHSVQVFLCLYMHIFVPRRHVPQPQTPASVSRTCWHPVTSFVTQGGTWKPCVPGSYVDFIWFLYLNFWEKQSFREIKEYIYI